MELRDPRLMSYRGVPNWPPIWVQRKSAGGQQTLHSEIGIFKTSETTGIDYRKSFLFMEHEGFPVYRLFNVFRSQFCRPIAKCILLQAEGIELKLGDHPLSYREISNWPPVWMWVDGKENDHLVEKSVLAPMLGKISADQEDYS